jgi:chromosome segregation ATPase
MLYMIKSKTLTQRVRRLEKFIETASKDSKYRITLKGETLSTYDYNPEDRLKELSEQLEGTKRILAKVTTDNGQLQTALQTQETDNARLATDLRDISNKRDQLVVDNKILTHDLEESDEASKEAEKEVKRLKGRNPLKAYSGFELIKLGLGKIVRR